MSKNKTMHFGGSFKIYNNPHAVKTFIQAILSGNRPDIIPGMDRIYITRVLYNGPATIIFWSDGTKTMTKCHDVDHYSAEVGFINAYLKRVVGSKEVHDAVCSWVPEDVNKMENRAITIADVRKKYKEVTI